MVCVKLVCALCSRNSTSCMYSICYEGMKEVVYSRVACGRATRSILMRRCGILRLEPPLPLPMRGVVPAVAMAAVERAVAAVMREEEDVNFSKGLTVAVALPLLFRRGILPRLP